MLLSVLILTSVAINVPLSAYRNWFLVTYNTIFADLQVSRRILTACFEYDTAVRIVEKFAVLKYYSLHYAFKKLLIISYWIDVLPS